MAKLKKEIIKNTLILLDKILPVLLLIVISPLSMPHLALASNLDVPTIPQLPYDAGKQEYFMTYKSSVPRLPETDAKREPQLVYKVWLTAYNSHPYQTHSTPCITASGMDVCARNREDIIATNFLNLPFGTKVRFPELYGPKIFVVEDRMNSRYFRHADIWMKDYAKAKSFGSRWTTIEIF